MGGIAVAAPCPATGEAAFGPEAVRARQHHCDAARLLRIIAGTMRACPTPPQSPPAATAAAAGASKSSARGQSATPGTSPSPPSPPPLERACQELRPDTIDHAGAFNRPPPWPRMD
jgi:hypothetical protein